jgi:hypothetical protein
MRPAAGTCAVLASASIGSERPVKIARETVLASLAPALLCCVALLQFTLTRTSGLSPWKGGGFGMFSTVDSPAARFLRITLFTNDGAIRALNPSELRTLDLKLRTMPTRSRAIDLADKLAAGKWTRLSMESAQQHYESLLRGSGAESKDTLSQANSIVEFDFVRMLEADETAGRPEMLVPITGARVEVHKYNLDLQSRTLTSQLVLVAERRR